MPIRWRSPRVSGSESSHCSCGERARASALEARAHELLARLTREVLRARVVVALLHLRLLRRQLLLRALAVSRKTLLHERLARLAREVLLCRVGVALRHLVLLRT